jgi:DNA-binding transcriptional LysR family regulator
MIPELRQLRYFVTVAEELHFSRAARRLNIAQPPLSQQIRQLEAAVGAQLFVRTSRKVELTPAGSAFLEGARRALSEAERAAEMAQRASKGETETVRVGFTDSAALSILPGTIRRFRAELPMVHLDLSEASTLAQLDAVRLGVVDIAFVRGPVTGTLPPDLRSQIVLEESFSVALPIDHALAKKKRSGVRALAGEPMVLFPRHLAPAFHDIITTMCRDAGFSPVISQEAAEYQTILSLVAAGLGVSIVPASIRNLGRTGVVFRPLLYSGAAAQVVAVFRQHRRSNAVEALVKYARAEGGS